MSKENLRKRSFLEKYCEKESEDESRTFYNIPHDHILESNRLSARVSKARAGVRLLPQSFIVALVSQYDSFLGGLLRCLYRSKPELLNQSEKQLDYSELSGFGDIEQAKDHILEKEIETLLRMSHPDQFDSLQHRFTIPLKENLPIWPVFVELTERRNLFVHCSGKVSAQYLVVCERHRVKYGTQPSVGNELGVTAEYFEQAHACVFEIGTKLGHVLWRKILPSERERADRNLNDLVYDLLVNKKFDLAVILGDFALNTLKKYSHDDLRRVMVVNFAQAHKWKKNQAEADRIIDEHDWSSCSHEFKLAIAVLKNDFPRAAEIMKTIGRDGPVQMNDYRDWPLFTEFRSSSEFATAFENVFGQKPEPLEATPIDKFLVEIAQAEKSVIPSAEAKPIAPAQPSAS